MKKILILLVLFCFLFSCERKQSNFSEEMIEKLADRGEIKGGTVRLPAPSTSFLPLYVLINNNEFHRCNSDELFYLYKKNYSNKFQSFEDFLNAVLNQDFVFDKKIFKTFRNFDSFKLNPKIEKQYLDLGFNEFLKKYSRETVSKRLALNRKIVKEGEYSTLVYILFKNGYDISSDCYLGIDYIRKREDSFK